MKHIEFLYDKFCTKFDLYYISKVQNKFPFNNVYFLTCFTEVLNSFVQEGVDFNSRDSAIESIIKKATFLYENNNISNSIS